MVQLSYSKIEKTTISITVVLFASIVFILNVGCSSFRNSISKDKEYMSRIQSDTINGVYIPKDLEDCFLQLDKLLSEDDKDFIKNLENRNETIILHHGLGMALRNNWGLWGGSRLQTYLKNKKLKHPDNMSAIILEFYYDWLNNVDDWRKWADK